MKHERKEHGLTVTDHYEKDESLPRDEMDPELGGKMGKDLTQQQEFATRLDEVEFLASYCYCIGIENRVTENANDAWYENAKTVRDNHREYLEEYGQPTVDEESFGHAVMVLGMIPMIRMQINKGQTDQAVENALYVGRTYQLLVSWWANGPILEKTRREGSNRSTREEEHGTPEERDIRDKIIFSKFNEYKKPDSKKRTNGKIYELIEENLAKEYKELVSDDYEARRLKKIYRVKAATIYEIVRKQKKLK